MIKFNVAGIKYATLTVLVIKSRKSVTEAHEIEFGAATNKFGLRLGRHARDKELWEIGFMCTMLFWNYVMRFHREPSFGRSRQRASSSRPEHRLLF